MSCLVDSGVEGDSIELLFIVVYTGNEVWQWWVKVGGRSEHAEETLDWRVLILLEDEQNSASKSSV